MTWHQGYLFQSKPRSIPTPAAMSTDCNGLLRILSSSPSSSWFIVSRLSAASCEADAPTCCMASCVPSLIWLPFSWAAGLPLAALTGYLRIAADRHYLSDVLVGAGAGTLFGTLVPRLLHSPGAAATPQQRGPARLPALTFGGRF